MDDKCVIGYGVVGKATAELFGIKKYFDLNGSTITLADAAKCKLVFVCLPTEVNPDGTYNTTAIEQIIGQIEENGNPLYIIRSTVWPGYAMHLMDALQIDRIISNPEFLSEKSAEKDSKFPPFILLGGAVPRYLDMVKGLYEGRIKSAPVILTDNTTAELAKLAMNAYFATKVIYANTIYDYAQSIGANYQRVKEILEKHPYGPRNHFTVWYNGKRGFGGRCLPKDTKALAHYSGEDLINKIMELNENYIYQKEAE